jgi:hypothetical protein
MEPEGGRMLTVGVLFVVTALALTLMSALES